MWTLKHSNGLWPQCQNQFLGLSALQHPVLGMHADSFLAAELHLSCYPVYLFSGRTLVRNTLQITGLSQQACSFCEAVVSDEQTKQEVHHHHHHHIRYKHCIEGKVFKTTDCLHKC